MIRYVPIDSPVIDAAEASGNYVAALSGKACGSVSSATDRQALSRRRQALGSSSALAQRDPGRVRAAGPVHATARVRRGGAQIETGYRRLGPSHSGRRSEYQLLVYGRRPAVDGAANHA